MDIFMPELSATTDTSSFTLSLSMTWDENLQSGSTDFQLQVETVPPAESTTSTTKSIPTSYHGPSPNERHDIRSKAEKMNSEGCLEKFIAEYVNERKCYIKLRFQNPWDENLSTSSNIQRLEWEVLKVKIMYWIREVYCSLRHIFAYENQLSEYVFEGLGNASTAHSCFIAIVTGPLAQLLDFPEALCSCRRSPERLQKMLLLHTRFSLLIAVIDSYFGASEEGKSIRVRVDIILSRLGEVVRLTLDDLEAAILGDLDKYPSSVGEIHRLTKYITTYIIYVSDNQAILEDLIVSKPLISSGNAMISELEVRELGRLTPLAAHLLWIIIILRLNLESKSKSYQDPSLTNLFMMNNVHYIVQGIRKSEVLIKMVGDYLYKLAENVQQAMSNYLKATWDPVVYCFRDEGLQVVRWGFIPCVPRNVLKDRVKKFNKLFAETYCNQKMWTVPDHSLRQEVQQSIEDKLIPTYRNYLGKLKSHIVSRKRSEKYILYSVGELEDRISELFSGPIPLDHM